MGPQIKTLAGLKSDIEHLLMDPGLVRLQASYGCFINIYATEVMHIVCVCVRACARARVRLNFASNLGS